MSVDAICLVRRMVFSLWRIRSKIRPSKYDGGRQNRGADARCRRLKAAQRELSGVETQITDTGGLAPLRFKSKPVCSGIVSASRISSLQIALPVMIA